MKNCQKISTLGITVGNNVCVLLFHGRTYLSFHLWLIYLCFRVRWATTNVLYKQLLQITKLIDSLVHKLEVVYFYSRRRVGFEPGTQTIHHLHNYRLVTVMLVYYHAVPRLLQFTCLLGYSLSGFWCLARLRLASTFL